MTDLRHQIVIADRIADRRRMFLGVLVIGALFGFGSTAQTMLFFDSAPMAINGVPLHPAAEATLRISLNLLTAAGLAFLASRLRLQDRRCAVALPLAMLLAILLAIARALLQMMLGVFPWSIDSNAVSGVAVVVPIGFMIIAIGMVIVRLSRSAREADRARLAEAVRASLALEQLQQEELRVRREVADTLHGTLQHRFVLLEARIREVASRLEQNPDANEVRTASAELRNLSAELDELRERELRSLSVALYPEALDRGLVPATPALVARIPESIPVSFSAEGMPTPDALGRTGRLLMVRVVEEGISNALRHGRASRIDMSLSERNGEYLAEVRHSGFVPAKDRTLSGLARLGNRLAELGGEIELAPEASGGVLRARIPVAAQTPAGDGRLAAHRQPVSAGQA